MLAPKCSKLLLSRILPSMLSLIRCHKECKHTYVSFGSQLMLIWPNNWLSTRHGEFDWIGANIWHADGMVLVQLEKLGATPLLRLVAPYTTAAYLSPHRLWPPRRKTCNLVPHGWKFVKQADASIIISKILEYAPVATVAAPTRSGEGAMLGHSAVIAIRGGSCDGTIGRGWGDDDQPPPRRFLAHSVGA
jgi:hypothetical protein